MSDQKKKVDNKYKQKKAEIPIEDNRYAAHNDIKKLQPRSKVAIPTLDGVIRAKNWVDGNKK